MRLKGIVVMDRARRGMSLAVAVLAIAGLALAGCRREPAGGGAAPDASSVSGAAVSEAAAPETPPVPLQDLEAAELLALNVPLRGDLADMKARRFIRALVPYSRTFYFLDGPIQRGVAYDALMEFERSLAAATPKGSIAPKIVIIPTSRDRLLPALAEGYGDLAFGGFTVTEARRDQVDFSDPTRTGVRHLVVTGPEAPPVASLEDLSGREVHVRASSSYHEDLVALNERFRREGRAPVTIRPADELLEDEDLLEMTDAGLVPITVVKDFTVRSWAPLYDRLTVHEDLALRRDGQVAVALRKDAPAFRAVVNEFVRTHRVGTLFGNMIAKRYFDPGKRLKNSTATAELARFRALAAHFRKYGEQYDIDWILLGAQGYQESQLDQGRRSHVGAVGVMQIKPETAADRNVGIPDVFTAENNIHAGTKYLRFMIDRYYADAPMDRLNKGLFALASYNAGPARVARLRARAEQVGLDPNVWFRNVEIIAAREIGRETVDYVGNIYKYYAAYKGVVEQRAARDKVLADGKPR